MCLKCNLCVSLCVSERVKERKRKEGRKEGRIGCRIYEPGNPGGQVHVQASWSDGVCSAGCLARICHSRSGPTSLTSFLNALNPMAMEHAAGFSQKEY